MNSDQISIRHHYVPQWYQRGFLPEGKGEFFVLDKSPQTNVECPDGLTRAIKNPKFIRRSGAHELFQQDNLYALSLPFVDPDFLERYLFGSIDDKGSIASRVFIDWPITIPHPKFDQYPMQFGDPGKRMVDLVQFINAQKTRMPRGIDAMKFDLKRRLRVEIDNNFLMAFFMERSRQQCTVWSEALWQIFSVESEDSRFLLSDDPVTFYNMDCYPMSSDCLYPMDPNPFWRGTRVLFPLSSKKLLVLSHKEHVDIPSRTKARRLRRNARLYDSSVMSFTWIEHEKHLSESEVHALNYVIKSRAVRFVASAYENDLNQDKFLPKKWSEIDAILQPTYPSHHAKSEVHFGFQDGRTQAFNAFGEEIESKADEMKQRVEALLEKERNNQRQTD
ncbi:MAG: DUF4238 domain-containing protein [Hyphomonas sp.]|uniref:DUF4238 domain-containing protein n=1 Tax=Hyphomonas sp. TaxID=87 RepID=UPI0030033EFD